MLSILKCLKIFRVDSELSIYTGLCAPAMVSLNDSMTDSNTQYCDCQLNEQTCSDREMGFSCSSSDSDSDLKGNQV